MFSLETLDVLIGLATIYLMFGIACTSAVEAVTSWLRIRSRNLETALSELFPGATANGALFIDQFYAHPLIQSLSKGPAGRPSYIPPEIVSRAVEAVLVANSTAKTLADAIESLPGTATDNRLKGLLKAITEQANDNIESFRFALENQFDAVMDRASGWYKRYTQRIALIVAAVLVVGANIDSIEITTQLATNPAMRLKMVEVAEQQLAAAQANANAQGHAERANGNAFTLAQARTEQALQNLETAKMQMVQNGLRFGWTNCPDALQAWASKVVGLLISIFAISLGAPFWFSVLQRFMQVRATGQLPHEKEKH